MKLAVFRSVGTTFVFGLRHFPAFFLLSLLVYLPSLIYMAVSGKSEIGQFMLIDSWQNDLLTGVEMMLGAFVTAVMVWTLLHDRQGEGWAVLAGLREACARLPMVLGVGFVFAVVMTMTIMAMEVLGEIAPVAALLPMLVIVVLSLVFAVTLPAAAMEEEGVIECIVRSAALTGGSRLRIFAAYLLVGIPLAIAMGISIVVVLTYVVVPPDMEAFASLPMFWVLVGASVFNVFLFAAPVAFHEQLAELDDGIEMGETAAVFD
jgi:hypothetical protein